MIRESDPETLIVGAGIAGLALARLLTRAQREVLVVEASDRVGGRIRTEHDSGFLLDRGFQVLLTAYPEITNHLELEDLRLCHFESGVMLFTGRGFERFSDPFRNPARIFSTLAASSLTLADKSRLLGLKRRLLAGAMGQLDRGSDTRLDVALRAMGFSEGSISSFFRPLLSGIQLTDGLEGSARLGFFILRMLFLGTAAVPQSGMEEIPRQLASAIPPESIRCLMPVQKIEKFGACCTDGTRIRARNVVIATDGLNAARLLGKEQVSSRSQTCVYFRAPRPPSGTRAIILDGQGSGPVRNLAILSNVAPNYSFTDEALVVATAPGVLRGNIPEGVVVQLRSWFGEQVSEWSHLRTYVTEYGHPIFMPGSPMRRPIELGNGLFVCGDHRDTPSIQGALVSGRRVFEKIN